MLLENFWLKYPIKAEEREYIKETKEVVEGRSKSK